MVSLSEEFQSGQLLGRNSCALTYVYLNFFKMFSNIFKIFLNILDRAILFLSN
jgi:hypothetical protein